jgi:TPR repeat protein
LPVKTLLLPLFRMALLSLPLLLQGCFTAPLASVGIEVGVEGAQQGYDAVRRPELKKAAAGDDPRALFNLGNSYCCKGGGPMDHLTVYDNDQATHYYCEAARQGYGPAQLRLAHLYSGAAIRGLHIALRVSSHLGVSEIDRGEALMWAQVAADNGVEEAPRLHQDILAEASSQDRARADTLLKDWKAAPCEWSEVFAPPADTTSTTKQ